MINFNDIYVDFPEYSYFKELSGSDKIEYLIEIYDLELRKQNLDQNLAEGLNDFFNEIPNEEEQEYCEFLQHFVQLDRGIKIPGAPVGCDFEIGDDYSMGKFEKQYGLL